jgi:hypothetical protein
MAIVTTSYRYKRPPRKRKAVALEVPAVVRKSDRRQRGREAAAESGEVPRLVGEAGESIAQPVPAPDDRKPAIITIRGRGKRFADVPDMTPEEHRRRGDAADALWRELVRRVREDP